MAYGQTPFSHLRNIHQKLLAITNPNKPIDFPPLRNRPLREVLQRCLCRTPEERPTIPELLSHPLLRPPDEPAAAPPAAPPGMLSKLLEQLSAVDARGAGAAGGGGGDTRSSEARLAEALTEFMRVAPEGAIDTQALLQELAQRGHAAPPPAAPPAAPPPAPPPAPPLPAAARAPPPSRPPMAERARSAPEFKLELLRQASSLQSRAGAAGDDASTGSSASRPSPAPTGGLQGSWERQMAARRKYLSPAAEDDTGEHTFS